MMSLKVLLPSEILVDEPARKIVAEAENGHFCLLPRHTDFAAALIPGLLMFVSESGNEEYLAVDEGILVKHGGDVLVSIRSAVRGADLGELRETVASQFEALDERERSLRSAAAKLESDFVRRFLELGETPRV
jgi:F-type H+-transporting ATPase subunit epsilon